MKRTPLRRVSTKRAKELRLYAKRRLLFLEAHPFCQIWLAKIGRTEADVDEGGYLALLTVPRSTEVHHKNGRNGWRLLDETEWCAASREQHEWVKQNQSEARRIGVLK